MLINNGTNYVRSYSLELQWKTTAKQNSQYIGSAMKVIEVDNALLG